MKTTSSLPILILGLLLLLPFGCSYTFQHATAETITIQIKDKERVTTGSGDSLSSKYLIFAEGETFKNTDAWMSGKWDSSDLYGALDRGHTYSVRVYGWRVPFLSMYRNIVRIEP